jgi:hypothetical protein
MDPFMVLSHMRHQYDRKIGQAAQSHHVLSIQNMTNPVMFIDMCPAQSGFNPTQRRERRSMCGRPLFQTPSVSVSPSTRWLSKSLALTHQTQESTFWLFSERGFRDEALRRHARSNRDLDRRLILVVEHKGISFACRLTTGISETDLVGRGIPRTLSWRSGLDLPTDEGRSRHHFRDVPLAEVR